MNIRKVEKKDMPQLIQLCKKHAAYERAEYIKSTTLEALSTHLFEQESPLQCLVVEEKERLMGYATFMKQFSTWDADFYVYLDCLYLKENIRGKGVGKVLMEKVMEYAKLQDCTLVQWQTPDFNTNAIRFYHKIGAKSNTKERFYWKV